MEQSEAKLVIVPLALCFFNIFYGHRILLETRSLLQAKLFQLKCSGKLKFVIYKTSLSIISSCILIYTNTDIYFSTESVTVLY